VRRSRENKRPPDRDRSSSVPSLSATSADLALLPAEKNAMFMASTDQVDDRGGRVDQLVARDVERKDPVLCKKNERAVEVEVRVAERSHCAG